MTITLHTIAAGFSPLNGVVKTGAGTLVPYVIALFIFLPLSSSAEAQPADSLRIPYIYVNSIPQNAEVYLNDTLLGFTPLRFPGGTVTGTLTIKKKGYQNYTYELQTGDTLLNKAFYLVSLSRKADEQLVTENKGRVFKKSRKILPITLFSGVTLGSAVSAYYFKNLANDKYEEYLNTGSPELLDETKRYDLFSGISIVVLQLGLIGLIYFLFIE